MTVSGSAVNATGVKNGSAIGGLAEHPGTLTPGRVSVRSDVAQNSPVSSEHETVCRGKTVFIEPCGHEFTEQKTCPWCGKAGTSEGFSFFLSFLLPSLRSGKVLLKETPALVHGTAQRSALALSGTAQVSHRSPLCGSAASPPRLLQAVTLWRYARQQAAQQKSFAGTMNKTAVTIILSSFRRGRERKLRRSRRRSGCAQDIQRANGKGGIGVPPFLFWSWQCCCIWPFHLPPSGECFRIMHAPVSGIAPSEELKGAAGLYGMDDAVW